VLISDLTENFRRNLTEKDNSEKNCSSKNRKTEEKPPVPVLFLCPPSELNSEKHSDKKKIWKKFALRGDFFVVF
jgi:hypothetical protein